MTQWASLMQRIGLAFGGRWKGPGCRGGKSNKLKGNIVSGIISL